MQIDGKKEIVKRLKKIEISVVNNTFSQVFVLLAKNPVITLTHIVESLCKWTRWLFCRKMTGRRLRGWLFSIVAMRRVGFLRFHASGALDQIFIFFTKRFHCGYHRFLKRNTYFPSAEHAHISRFLVYAFLAFLTFMCFNFIYFHLLFCLVIQMESQNCEMKALV